MSGTEASAESAVNRLGFKIRPVFIVVVILAVVGTGLMISHVLRSQQVEAVASRARESVAEGSIEEARSLLEDWRKVAPDEGEVDYYQAWLDVRAKKPAQAMDGVRAASRKGYPLAELEIIRAITLAQTGHFEDARPVLAAAFQSGTGPIAEVADALVGDYLQTVQLSGTNTVLSHWMEVAPWDPRPYVWRAEVYKRGGRESELIVRDLREALRRDPSLDDARLELATYLDPSQITEAEEEYSTVLEHQPRNTVALTGLGKLAILKGDLNAASKYFEDALAIDPNLPKALRELALLDVKFGRFKQAKERLERAVALEPDEVEMRHAFARVLSAVGDTRAAAEQTKAAEQLRKDQKRIEELRNQLAGQPDNLDLRLQVARWLIEHGHDKEGLEWTQRVLAQKPDHPATCRFLADYYTRTRNPGLANYYRLQLSETAAENSK